MSPVVPRLRRPDQNTGRRAKAVREVESVACEARGGENHLLIKYGETVVCVGCGVSWADLDGELNQRAGWLE